MTRTSFDRIRIWTSGGVAALATGALLALASAGGAAAAAEAAPAELVLAALPLVDVAGPVARQSVIPVQTGFCGCENGKQKIWKTIGGTQVCTVTNLPCTNP